MNRREVRFSVTPEEWEEITAYVLAKKRWRQVSHMVREAVFQLMERNAVGSHHKRSDTPDEKEGSHDGV